MCATPMSQTTVFQSLTRKRPGRIALVWPVLRAMLYVHALPVNFTNLHSYRGVGGSGGGSPPTQIMSGSAAVGRQAAVACKAELRFKAFFFFLRRWAQATCRVRAYSVNARTGI